MISKRLFYCSFAMVCFAMGCSEDSNLTITEAGTCGGQVCGANQKCKKGVCVDVVSTTPVETEIKVEDGLCTETVNGCKDETIRVVCVKGEAPVEEECQDGACSYGQCRNPEDIGLCSKTERYCLNESVLADCVNGEEMNQITCADEIENGVCRDGECVQGVSIGEACEYTSQCPPDAYCDYYVTGLCTPYRALGESCTGDDCAPDQICLEVCVKEVEFGEACGEFKMCSGGVCQNGICTAVSTEYGQCNDQLACPDNTVCIDNSCVPTKGECDSNKDCIGDSYCCLDSSCGEKQHICLPYSSEKPNDESCVFTTVSGMFEASVQCYWEPKEYPGYTTVANSVAVGKIHNNKGIEKPLIAFVAEQSHGFQAATLRIINSETCEDVESILLSNSSCYNHVSLADFDGDGYMELVSYDGNLVIYQWNESSQKHVPVKISANLGIGNKAGYFSIHDLDNDGVPEIIGINGTVVHSDGTILADYNSKVADIAGASYQTGDYNITSPTLGDLNGDGNVEFIADKSVFRWLPASNGWSKLVTLSGSAENGHTAYADFGTPGSNPSVFDYQHLDGKAEIVWADGGLLQVWAIFASDGSLLPPPQLLMNHSFTLSHFFGYPPAVGDFNGDHLPEIGVASRSTFGVYDPKCTGAQDGKCKSRYVIWESPTQDQSGAAGAAAFDFDGDGKIEIVYGDECYTRVYDGMSGEVLFSSYRNSGTVIEYPVIADVDNDGSTEIVISSDITKCGVSQDRSHRGVKCEVDSDCYSGSCVGGLCRCTSDAQCNWQTINGATFKQYSCLPPLSGDNNGGNVCRAIQGKTMPGITVLRDRLDRWVSSRPVWNQHAYNITNVNDDGSIPKTSDWKQNFTTEGLNNYRQQKQGPTGSGVAPDITGRFTSAADACKGNSDGISLTAQVCNRGTKAVGSKMPAVFYKGSIAPENILCVSYTEEMVPIMDCRDVSCTISKEQAEQLTNEKIVLVVNDDGKGGKTTVECNESNNTDEIVMAGCQIN